MSFRSLVTVPNNKWILKALSASQNKDVPLKLVLFFDVTQRELPALARWSAPKEGRAGSYVFFKATYILWLYNAHEFLLFLGEFGALLCSPDVPSFLQNLLHYSKEQLPIRLAGCSIYGAFTNLWPRASQFAGSGEHFVPINALQAFYFIYDTLLLHREKGLFHIYRVLLKVYHFYSCFFFFSSLWPFLFNSLTVAGQQLKEVPREAKKL